MMRKMTALAGNLRNALRHRIILLLAVLALALAFVGSPCGSIHSPQELAGSHANRKPLWSADGQSIVVSLGYRIYRVSADGSTVARLPAVGEDGQFSPSLSPDGRIAYLDATERTPRLAVISSDGTEIKQYTKIKPDFITIPVWSPTGQQIAFGKWADNPNDSDNVISQAVIMTDSGLVSAADLPYKRGKPVWSNSGERVAFTWNYGGCYQEDRCAITISDTNGASKTVVDLSAVPNPDDSQNADYAILSSVAWSADDRTIYYALKQGAHLPAVLYSTDLSTMETRHIIALGDSPIYDLSISPDYGKLAFSWQSEASTNTGLFLINADGTDLREITGQGSAQFSWWPRDVQVSWSPDGNRLAVTEHSPFSSGSLFTIAPDGSDYQILLWYDSGLLTQYDNGVPIRYDYDGSVLPDSTQSAPPYRR